jgi:tripartite-type tricarboxylate transporter receptor subunit TctC
MTMDAKSQSLLRIGGAVCLAALLSMPISSSAQAFPTKPIRLVVAFEASSGGDVAARMVAAKISENLGHQMLVENRAGAGGGIAAEMVARASPDGYTLLFTTPNPQVIRPFLSKNIAYDPVKDFTPVAMLWETVAAMIVNPQLPVNSVKELVDYARRNPGKLSYGSSGIGSAFHLSGELLKQVAKLDLVHVPYKGGAPAISDLTAGRIQMMFIALATALPMSNSGKVRILAVQASKRFPGLSQGPTTSEALPGFEDPPLWIAIFGPAGLPQTITERWNREFSKVLNLSEMRDKLASMGFSVVATCAEETGARLKRDIQLVGKIITGAGITPE